MSGTPGTQSISRTINILHSFDRVNPDLSLKDIAKKNILHPTTAYRILQALVEAGFLIQNPESTKYSLGYGLVMLGEIAKQGNALLKLACPYAEKLAQITGESITIEVLNHNFMLDAILFIPSSYRVAAQATPGKPLPAYCTATGKVQLAFLPTDQLEIVFARGLKSLTAKTIIDPVDLNEQLSIVRARGYAIAKEEMEPDLVAVAAPIFGDKGQVLAGISVGGPVSRLTDERIIEMAARVVEVAREISKEVGYKEKPEDDGMYFSRKND